MNGKALACVTDMDSLKEIMPDAPVLKGVKKFTFFSDIKDLKDNGVEART